MFVYFRVISVLNTPMLFSLVIKFSPERHLPVCPSAFAKAHNRGHTYYDEMVKELKQGALSGDGSLFNKHCPMTPAAVKHLIERGGHFGLKLNPADFAAVTLKRTMRSLFTCNWMTDYFKMTGNKSQYNFLQLLIIMLLMFFIDEKVIRCLILKGKFIWKSNTKKLFGRNTKPTLYF